MYSKGFFTNKQINNNKKVTALTEPGWKRTCQDQITAVPAGAGTETIWSTSFSSSQTRIFVDKNALNPF